MESDFAFEVAETALALRRDFDRRAAGLGVTRAQWRVLARLGGGNAVRQVELAEALDVEPMTLCRMIDRLSKAGLVERRCEDEDRRAWRIYLTPDAASVITRLCVITAEILDDGLDGISVEEQAFVLKVLGRVRSNIAGTGVGAEGVMKESVQRQRKRKKRSLEVEAHVVHALAGAAF